MHVYISQVTSLQLVKEIISHNSEFESQNSEKSLICEIKSLS